MGRYSIQEFIQQTQQRDRSQGVFELESDRMLELNLNGAIWTKMGSMVAYRGAVKFTREGMLDQGIGNLLKKAVSGEGAQLTKAEGQGKGDGEQLHGNLRVRGGVGSRHGCRFGPTQGRIRAMGRPESPTP